MLYDDVNRSGLIQARLRAIHRNVKQGDKKVKKRLPPRSGGPQLKRRNSTQPRFEECPNVDRSLHEFNDIVCRTNTAELKRLMTETFQHRCHIRLTNAQSILTLYTKFSECDFLVSRTTIKSDNCITTTFIIHSRLISNSN